MSSFNPGRHLWWEGPLHREGVLSYFSPLGVVALFKIGSAFVEEVILRRACNSASEFNVMAGSNSPIVP